MKVKQIETNYHSLDEVIGDLKEQGCVDIEVSYEDDGVIVTYRPGKDKPAQDTMCWLGVRDDS